MNRNLPSEQAGRPVPTVDEDAAWRQLVRRNAAATFFYAVTTTGVFCRAGCASRLPRREHVRLFATAEAAQNEGFRPCKRCRPVEAHANPVDKVRAYLEAHRDRAVRLKELGRVAGLSPYTVQRLFKQAMGVSPLQYLRALRTGELKDALRKGETVTDALYRAGFGSASRVYEGSGLGMTPARFAQGGRGERIGWCSACSPFGWIIVGATERGLCWLAIAGTKKEAEASLREEFPLAELRADAAMSRWVEAAMEAVAGGRDARRAELPLDLRGTAFQLKVWNALRRIPRGQTRSYSELARELGNPRATRAVARACATNRVALVVPCHRVVGASGSLTGYRWGVDRKRRLLDAERR
ncbi:MAG TPA: methylated-DNA--[protein]-cysteine S-methyltransferase [Terracidiphilus sp.]|nr:methylated-DNA--[protein]-cysteine S-methyltransferase [Terracidiphilus sp.]